jgi:hypothetical protein
MFQQISYYIATKLIVFRDHVIVHEKNIIYWNLLYV